MICVIHACVFFCNGSGTGILLLDAFVAGLSVGPQNYQVMPGSQDLPGYQSYDGPQETSGGMDNSGSYAPKDSYSNYMESPHYPAGPMPPRSHMPVSGSMGNPMHSYHGSGRGRMGSTHQVHGGEEVVDLLPC